MIRIIKIGLAITLSFAIAALFYNKIALEPVWDKVKAPFPSLQRPNLVDGTREATTQNDQFILGAVKQYGVTTHYNGAYQKLAYPNGDVDSSTGVCTDVIIRTFRTVNVDLQKEIHRDMKQHFRQYPRKWGLSSTDSNIDHRRVPNMETYFTRKGYQLPLSESINFENYLPGDLVVWRINSRTTHIGIVSDKKVPGTSRHFIIHNPVKPRILS